MTILCRLCRQTVLGHEDSYDICDSCGIQIARRFRERLAWEDQQIVAASREKRLAAEAERARREIASRPLLSESLTQQEPVVYYVRLGEHIKIGYSKSLRARLVNLRAHPSDLLAIEPGGRSQETKRHEEFNHLRIRPRWENFAEGPDLLAHIADLREQHGIPVWMNPPRASSYGRNTPVVVRKVTDQDQGGLFSSMKGRSHAPR